MFRIYDDDDNGLINASNLLRCAGDLGEDVTQEEVDMMITMATENDPNAAAADGVNKDNFIKIMKQVGLVPNEQSSCKHGVSTEDVVPNLLGTQRQNKK